MKRIIPMFLAICLCLCAGGMLTACGQTKTEPVEHTHSYQAEWSKDATSHWRACEGEACTDLADKAEHTWNNGEVTAEGKTFTCTACGQTKTEPVAYTVKVTVTKEEWETAFGLDVKVFQLTEEYGNSYGQFCYYDGITRIVANDGTDRFAVIYLKEANGGYEQYYTEVPTLSDVDGATNFTKTTVSENPFLTYYKTFLSQFMELYDKFEYDAEEQCYVASSVNDDILGATVFFENGKVTKIRYTDSYGYHGEYVMSYDDVALTLPTVG